MSSSLSDDGWGGGGKKKAVEMELDITPMIDVTFLLLIFFMVSSTMQATPDHDVPAAKHYSRLDQGAALVFFVTGGSRDSDPVIEQDQASGPIALEDVAAVVEQAVSGGKNSVIIRADKKVPTGYITEIHKKVLEVEGVQVTIGVRDKNR